MVMQMKVEGAAARIDALMRFDKAVWRDIQKGVKLAQDAITKDAKGRVPPMGLVPRRAGSGWGPWTFSRDGRDLSYNKRNFKFKTRFRSTVTQGFRQVEGRSELDVSNAAVKIFTLAGSKDKSGHPFNTNINRQTSTVKGARNVGMWPRLLTPAYHAKAPEAAKQIGALIEKAIDQANRA